MSGRLKSLTAAAATVAVLLSGARTVAQEQPPRRGGQPLTPLEQGRGQGRGAVTPQEIAQMLNAMMLLRAQETLQLRDDQYAPFIRSLRAFQATRQRLENQRNRLLRDLRNSLQAADSSETAIADRLKAVRDHESQAAVAMRQAWDAIDQVLDVRQQARFRVLEQDMERQQLDLLMRARGAARGR